MSIGIDVVDLTAARTRGVAGRVRFLERVFTEAERERILASEAPDLEAWLAWAAKEAAYKHVSVARGAAPVFTHRAYEVSWSARVDEEHRRTGIVACEDGPVPVDAVADTFRGHLHAVSVVSDREGPLRATVEALDRPGAPWARPLAELMELFTAREADAVHSHASAAVRIGARADAARWLGVETPRIEIVCGQGSLGRRPPMVLLDGSRSALEVSLSHDGPWIAWALARRTAP